MRHRDVYAWRPATGEWELVERIEVRDDDEWRGIARQHREDGHFVSKQHKERCEWTKPKINTREAEALEVQTKATVAWQIATGQL